MNDQTPINDSPELLKGCLWALATASVLTLFVMICWLGNERMQAQEERSRRHEVENDLAIARSDFNARLQECNQQIAQAQSALADGQNQTQSALQAKVQAEAEYAQAKAQCDQDARAIEYLQSNLKSALNRARY